MMSKATGFLSILYADRCKDACHFPGDGGCGLVWVQVLLVKGSVMAISETVTVNAPLDQVVAAFSNEDFARYVSQRLRVTLDSFSVAGDTAGSFTATSVRGVPADRVPDMAKKFVSKGLSLTQTDQVSDANADGSRVVTTEIKAGGVPISAKAVQTLTAVGEATKVDVNGEVNSSIPFVGKKIAATAEPYAGKALSLVARSLEEWLKTNS